MLQQYFALYLDTGIPSLDNWASILLQMSCNNTRDQPQAAGLRGARANRRKICGDSRF